MSEMQIARSIRATFQVRLPRATTWQAILINCRMKMPLPMLATMCMAQLQCVDDWLNGNSNRGSASSNR